MGICVTWECPMRRKSHCGATARERHGFAANGAAHVHPLGAMAQVSRVAPRAMREAGESKPYKSGSAVAWKVAEEYLESNPDLDPSLLPKMETLRRKANKCREAGRPSGPRDLHFRIDFSSIPGRSFRGAAASFSLRISSWPSRRPPVRGMVIGFRAGWETFQATLRYPRLCRRGKRLSEAGHTGFRVDEPSAGKWLRRRDG